MKNFRSERKYRGTRCLNCEHPLDLSDKYCPNCGQLNSTKKLKFDDFFNEFFAGIFAYDSRLRRTVTALLFYPGKISQDYIRGKRMRYANPFRFYLSASIIFFILWNLTNDFSGLSNQRSSENLTPQEKEQLREDLSKIPQLKNSPINLDSVIISSPPVVEENYKENYVSQEKLDTLGLFKSLSPQAALYNSFYKETSIAQSSVAMDSLNHDHSTFNHWFYKKVVDFDTLENDPAVFINYFLSKLPFIIFFYIPVFALFIWLLYLRRPYTYMEHLIFTFHVQTTFFVMMTAALIFDYIFGTDWFTTIILIAFLFYLYKAMRKFYGQRRFKTLVKFILLNGLFLILAFVAAVFSLLASFAIY